VSEARVDRRTAWLARVGALFIRVLAFTWRVRFVNGDVVQSLKQRRQPFTYILWHGQLLPLLWTHRDRDVAIMVSEHRDGEIIARVATSLGFRLVRGSTSRGAARALLMASRELESGFDLAITVDGPRGPAKSVAPGALIIAQRTGAPMVPTAASANRAWRLRSWDKFMIPKPFARITVAYGDPILVARNTARDAAEDTDGVRVAIDGAADVAAAG
jgi:hypothetical protein